MIFYQFSDVASLAASKMNLALNSNKFCRTCLNSEKKTSLQNAIKLKSEYKF